MGKKMCVLSIIMLIILSIFISGCAKQPVTGGKGSPAKKPVETGKMVEETPKPAPSSPSGGPDEGIDPLISKGRRYLVSGEYEKAVGAFSEVLKKDIPKKQKKEALISRADVYAKLKKFDLAEKDLKKAIELGDDEATPHIYLIIWIYNNTDEDKKAYKALRRAEELGFEKDPAFNVIVDDKEQFSQAKLANFYVFAGNVCNNNAKYNEAIKYFDKAEKMGSKNDELLMGRAMCYYKMGKKEGAEKDAKKFLESGKHKDTSIHTAELEMISNACLITGDYDRAMKTAKRALLLDPKSYGFNINIARIHIAKGEYDLAQKSLDIVKKNKDKGRWDMLELERLEKIIKEKGR